MNLTSEQLRIINHRGGHARVSAVAGSGKTTTMVERIGRLLERGIAAENILVLMFNRSARQSFEQTMRSRLAAVDRKLPEIRTFHSLGLRLVNSFTRRGSLAGCRLVTEEYVAERLARSVANEVCRQQQGEGGILTSEDVEEFLTFIDRVKSCVETPHTVFSRLDLPKRLDFFPAAFLLFEQMRQKQRLRFFADLIYDPLMALRGDADLIRWVADRVDHIIVDEYQDINETQQHLLRIVAGERARVMAVGDVDQCIYEWRGARPEYMTTRFAADFANPAEYRLSYTFRYGHRLSLAANHLIANNIKRDGKQCISHPLKGPTELCCLEQGATDRLVAVLRTWMEKGRSLGEAAILVRLFAQTVPVELALLEASIPYTLEGGANIFDCEEILGLTGYLKLALDTLQNEPLDQRRRILTAMFCQPHLGIKKKEIETLAESVALHCANDSGSVPAVILGWKNGDYPPFIRKRFARAAETWQWLLGVDPGENGADFLKKIVKRLDLYDFYHSFSGRAAAAENRVRTCEALIDFAGKRGLSVQGVVDTIDEFKCGRVKEDRQGILITSVHRAKGLEWPLVILPGLEEGVFPFFREKDAATDMEDERRLFYVGMTRAVERLVLIHPADVSLKKSIAAHGALVREPSRASRFLFEANPGLSVLLGRYLEQQRESDTRTVAATDIGIARTYLAAVGSSIRLVESADKQREGSAGERGELKEMEILRTEQIHEGMSVVHPKFGCGRVVAVRDRRQGRLLVDFDNHGEMILLASYARLRG
ncbi:ATP-dependent helicase [Desulforhopalus singaporensis]|uniref:DNA 3'-5' helicase n=1 Tax=Desulforhopalus singaporensis TaxID=91360 RepID=A0A1H0LXW1_9BACT|nr:ATP-dependent helicase [Desulforhopalus singaporensis]SDO73038.1 DNA helicase-2 / ATP-dependent DNA helicase PcrA [Desulforhopalus singaporensis]